MATKPVTDLNQFVEQTNKLVEDFQKLGINVTVGDMQDVIQTRTKQFVDFHMDVPFEKVEDIPQKIAMIASTFNDLLKQYSESQNLKDVVIAQKIQLEKQGKAPYDFYVYKLDYYLDDGLDFASRKLFNERKKLAQNEIMASTFKFSKKPFLSTIGDHQDIGPIALMEVLEKVKSEHRAIKELWQKSEEKKPWLFRNPSE